MIERHSFVLRGALCGIVPLLAGLVGCGGYAGLAGRYADAEVAAAGELAPMGSLAYRLCRKHAAYAFVLEVQNLPAEPPSWPQWYGSAKATTLGTTPMTWQAYCDQSEHASNVIHGVARGLRAHGRALAALAEGKPFDASGLQSAADGVATASAALGASSDFGTKAHDVGSAFATATKTFLQLYRDREIERIVADSDGCMQQTFAHLSAFADALDERLRDTEHDRALVVRTLAAAPARHGLDRALVLVESLETSGEADHELRQIRLAIGAYRAAIGGLVEAHGSLAVLADPKERKGEDPVKAALSKLEASVQDLGELER